MRKDKRRDHQGGILGISKLRVVLQYEIGLSRPLLVMNIHVVCPLSAKMLFAWVVQYTDPECEVCKTLISLFYQWTALRPYVCVYVCLWVNVSWKEVAEVCLWKI